jgi:hypothetical protein
MYLFSQQPKIERLVVYRWDGNAGVALLFVELIQLFEKVDLGPRRSFDRVEALQPCLEAEGLWIGKQGKPWA